MTAKKKASSYYVYIVRCQDGSLYTGTAKNVPARIQQHNTGKGAKYTRAFGPVTLLKKRRYKNRSRACQVEAEIKKWPRRKKLEWAKLVFILLFGVQWMASAATHKKPNRLINEKSPYLLQHATNPVDWYPWGDEAIQTAQKLNRPIFLSIGYSTCHWCHVMEHESFEDPDVAAIMNKHFINIKVDREERPDLDTIYMTAVQALTGRGGWPMSVWLTPDLKPFYGGTYFPPEDRYGMPGFKTILDQVSGVWEKEQEKVQGSADHLTDAIRRASAATSTGDNKIPDVKEVFKKAFAQLSNQYESNFGGFGKAPKFPMPTYLDFLLHYYVRSKDKKALEMVQFTLKKMIQGGIYDQLGGGFARYSTDEKWIVPHFEKMLYDNGQLLGIIAHVYQITGDDFFKDTLVQSLEYIARDMTHDDGAFYSAEDADSEGKEGTFYLWTLVEIKKILGDKEADVVIARFGVTANGNFMDPHTREEGQNILVRAKSILETATETKLSEKEVRSYLEEGMNKLFEARSKRIRPHLDDKVLTGWNGLMISALAKSAAALENTKYSDAAVRAAQFIEKNLYDGEKKQLFRRWREGEKKIHAHQIDYALLIQGLLDLFQVNGDSHWIEWATALQEQHDKLFFDEKSGGYYMTIPLDDLLVRMKDDSDNVIPSGNSIAVLNGLRLAKLLDRKDFTKKAEATLTFLAKPLSEIPASVTTTITGLDFFARGNLQVVVLGPSDRADTQKMMTEIHKNYWPGSWIIPIDPRTTQKKLAKIIPFTATMQMIDDKATAYVCIDYACQKPTSDLETLQKQLSSVGGN